MMVRKRTYSVGHQRSEYRDPASWLAVTIRLQARLAAAAVLDQQPGKPTMVDVVAMQARFDRRALNGEIRDGAGQGGVEEHRRRLPGEVGGRRVGTGAQQEAAAAAATVAGGDVQQGVTATLRRRVHEPQQPREGCLGPGVHNAAVRGRVGRERLQSLLEQHVRVAFSGIYELRDDHVAERPPASHGPLYADLVVAPVNEDVLKELHQGVARRPRRALEALVEGVGGGEVVEDSCDAGLAAPLAHGLADLLQIDLAAWDAGAAAVFRDEAAILVLDALELRLRTVVVDADDSVSPDGR